MSAGQGMSAVIHYKRWDFVIVDNSAKGEVTVCSPLFSATIYGKDGKVDPLVAWPDGFQGDYPNLTLEQCREFSTFLDVLTRAFTEVVLREQTA